MYGVILLAAGCTRTPPEAVPASAPTPGTAAARLAAELDGLSLDDFFDASFRALTLRSPETVVEAGLTNIYGVTNVALDDISDAYVQETYALTAVILDALESYDRAALSPEQQISYDVYRWYLQDRLAGQPFHQYEYPATYFQSTAVHESLRLFFTDIHPVRSLQDARDYVARLRLVDAKIEQLIAELDARAAAGLTPPAFAVDWAFYSSLHGLIRAGATATPFYTNLATKVAALPDASAAEKEALLADAETAVETAVLPAYQKLYDYLRDMPVYTGAASGVWRLPDGDAYYAYRLRHYTTTDLTADEIHALGLAELDRIHGAMRAVFDELGYPADESLVQLFDRVARDGGHVAGAEVLATYEA
ncbi:MAG: DUF885 domain-containing protein, partial [Anaerolineales bacterium]|nr:DUF885 domain-containing protein [Anaerolineales bacterium]